MAGCGGGSGAEREQLPMPSSAGAKVVSSSGCLSCHRIGDAGHNGPGSELTTVGSRLSKAQLRKALLQPPSGMPSFGSLSEKQRQGLVDYLAGLR